MKQTSEQIGGRTMDNNEIIENYAPEGAENPETTTGEEIVGEQTGSEGSSTDREPDKVYTQEEFEQKLNERVNQRLDEIIPKRIARSEAKLRKEYESKYGELERVMVAGTGEQDLSKITKSYREYYEGKGVKIPSAEPQYSVRDIEVLATAEANDIIGLGFDEVVAETDRLASIGVEKMDAREKAMFKRLAAYRQKTENANEYAKLGISADVYDSSEFKSFAGQFNANVPVSKVYELYNKTQPKKEVRTMGSMTSGNVNASESGVKDFYTLEEANRFTRADYDKNPELFKAVKKSMCKW